MLKKIISIILIFAYLLINLLISEAKPTFSWLNKDEAFQLHKIRPRSGLHGTAKNYTGGSIETAGNDLLHANLTSSISFRKSEAQYANPSKDNKKTLRNFFGIK